MFIFSMPSIAHVFLEHANLVGKVTGRVVTSARYMYSKVSLHTLKMHQL